MQVWRVGTSEGKDTTLGTIIMPAEVSTYSYEIRNAVMTRILCVYLVLSLPYMIKNINS